MTMGYRWCSLTNSSRKKAMLQDLQSDGKCLDSKWVMLWVNLGLGPKRNGTGVFRLVVYMFAFQRHCCEGFAP